jgi:3-oxoacyl-[acyl-carrier-protein] synthase-1
MGELTVVAMGAVTSVGLDTAQTCAAIRARVSGFREVMLLTPPRDPVLAAPVPAPRRGSDTPFSWLVRLACRAIQECLGADGAPQRDTALILSVPDAYREHVAIGKEPAALLHGVAKRLNASFHPSSVVLQEGRAAVLKGVSIARSLIEQRLVRRCLVGGVDSLVNGADAERLSSAGRLYEPGNPQGAIPGEGAAVLLLAGDSADGGFVRLLGVGLAREPDIALGERYAVGYGLRDALVTAGQDAGCDEERVSFRVSDMNGERYYAWDSLVGSTRFYRTHRERLPVWYPASCTGDLGAASAALSIIVAANAIARGFAPGPVAVCESSSDEGLRGACLVAPLSGRRQPPFVLGEE